MVFTHKNSQPTIGFIGTSVGSSPFSTATLFWLQPPYYGIYRGQNEKHHQIGMIRHSNRRHFFCCCRFTNAAILMVDCTVM
jgi:hypothetical protein